MTHWFISRHSGAIEWAKQQNLPVDRFESHLDVDEVKPGDHVYGTLPVELAAEVCRRGARFFSLSMLVPENQRGTELTAEDLIMLNARLREYRVIDLEDSDE